MNIKKLLRDQVLIDVKDEEAKTASGIIVAKEKEQGDYREGVVVAVGRGKMSEQYGLISLEVAIGDVVKFRYYGNPFILDGKNYALVLESDIVAII